MKLLLIPLVYLILTSCGNGKVPSNSPIEESHKVAVEKAVPVNKNFNLSTDNTLTLQKLKQIYGKNYLYYNFDINGDGIKDLLITVEPSKAGKVKDSDALYIYTAKGEDNYQFSLKMTNFSSDGGNSFSEIIPKADHKGFIISTAFPDRGRFLQYYYIKPADKKGNEWLFEKYVYDGDVIKDGETIGYYCVYPQGNSNLKTNFELKGENWTDEEKLTKCPSPSKQYLVTVPKANILNSNFEATNPPNYLIKGDKIEAVAQNDDWIHIMYKNDKKTGWVNKKDLVPK